MHVSIRINAQPNYGYPQPNYGYPQNYGYPNTYPERAYYPSGPVNPEQALAQNMGRELAYGDAPGAAAMLRQELYSNPRHALRLVNEANRDAGPRARDRIVSTGDGSLAIEDLYTGQMTPVNGRSAYAGFPPQGQVPGYYANANDNFYSGGVNPNPAVYIPNNGVYNPALTAWNTAPAVSFSYYGRNQGNYGALYAGYRPHQYQRGFGISIIV
jgi:hypothetical protein